MEDTKAKAFFEGVLSKTRAGRIRWQPTAEESDYIAAIGGQFTLSISSDRYECTLLLKDQDGRALTAVRGTDAGIEPMEIRELYETARRQALRVDDKIDQVLGELSKL